MFARMYTHKIYICNVQMIGLYLFIFLNVHHLLEQTFPLQ